MMTLLTQAIGKKNYSITEIPLSPDNQFYYVTLDNKNYKLAVEWNHMASFWMLSLTTDEGKTIFSCVPLLLKVNLLRQYSEPNGVLMVLSSKGYRDIYHRELGNVAKLYYLQLL